MSEIRVWGATDVVGKAYTFYGDIIITHSKNFVERVDQDDVPHVLGPSSRNWPVTGKIIIPAPTIALYNSDNYKLKDYLTELYESNQSFKIFTREDFTYGVSKPGSTKSRIYMNTDRVRSFMHFAIEGTWYDRQVGAVTSTYFDFAPDIASAPLAGSRIDLAIHKAYEVRITRLSPRLILSDGLDMGFVDFDFVIVGDGKFYNWGSLVTYAARTRPGG